MKKMLVILLFLLVGCSFSNEMDTTKSSLMISYPKKETRVSKNIVEVSDEMQLVSHLNQSLMKEENTFTYKTESSIDLDEVVRMLSYLVPFDLKLRQEKNIYKGSITYEITVEYTDSNWEKSLSYLKQVVDENITSDMTTEAKIDFAHQYILDHCEYDESVVERDDSNASAFQIQGVLFNQKAVCSGYSRCFLMMMKLMDIPCVYVSSDVINHSFNLVYDGEFRFIDVTWDENDNRYYYLDIHNFFDDGKHELSEDYDSEYFVNFLSYIYHLN